MKNLVVAFVLVAGLVASAYADGNSKRNATSQITVNAAIQRGLSMNVVGTNGDLNTGNATLDFGTITLSGSNTSATIAPASGVTLHIVGNDNDNLTFTVPASVSLSGPGAALTFTPNVLGSQTSTGGSQLSTSGESADGNGNYYIFVGGALNNIPATQATGSYSGQFNIVVSDNSL